MTAKITEYPVPAELPAGNHYASMFGFLSDGREVWHYGVDLGSGVGFDLRWALYNRVIGVLEEMPSAPGKNSVFAPLVGSNGNVVFFTAYTTTRAPTTGAFIGYNQQVDCVTCRWTPELGVEVLRTPTTEDGANLMNSVSQDGSCAAVSEVRGPAEPGIHDIYVLRRSGPAELAISGVETSFGSPVKFVSNNGAVIGGIALVAGVDSAVVWTNGVAAFVPSPAVSGTIYEFRPITCSQDGSVVLGYFSWEDEVGYYEGAFTFRDGVTTLRTLDASLTYIDPQVASADASLIVWDEEIDSVFRTYIATSTNALVFEFPYYVRIRQFNADMTRIVGSANSGVFIVFDNTPFWTGFVNSFAL